MTVSPSLVDVLTYDHNHEVDPRDVGMTLEGVRAIWRHVEAIYRTGLHPALTFCLRRHGQVVMRRSVGYASGAPGLAAAGEEIRIARPDTPFCLFSTSKTMTAMVIHLLDERGLLHIDDPVVEYIPEFGKYGKDVMTIRHVLTHRAGIPSLAVGHASLDMLADWDAVIALLCEARPMTVPGRQLAYHAITGGFILGEIVRRVAGSDIRAFFAEAVGKPLGLEVMSYGLVRERWHEVAVNYLTGMPAPPPIGWVVQRALGMGLRRVIEVSNDPRWYSGIVPSANAFATADDVSRFFQLLMRGGELDGVRVFAPRTIRRVLNESSYLELDVVLGIPARYGLGVMLGGNFLSFYGPDTPKAFGHYGFTLIIGWADPQRDIAVGFLASGKCLIDTHLIRLFGLLREISTQCSKVH